MVRVKYRASPKLAATVVLEQYDAVSGMREKNLRLHTPYQYHQSL